MEWNKAAAAIAIPAKGQYRFSEPCSLFILYTNRETPLIQTTLPAASWLNADYNFDFSTGYLTTYKDACDQLQPDDFVYAFTAALPVWFRRLFMNKKVNQHGCLKNFFRAVHQTEREAVLEISNKHLTCRISFLLTKPRPSAVQKNIILSTIVTFRNAWARLYFITMKPMYEWVLSTTLKRTVKKLQIKLCNAALI